VGLQALAGARADVEAVYVHKRVFHPAGDAGFVHRIQEGGTHCGRGSIRLVVSPIS
jgi:hypothetical protein